MFHKKSIEAITTVASVQSSFSQGLTVQENANKIRNSVSSGIATKKRNSVTKKSLVIGQILELKITSEGLPELRYDQTNFVARDGAIGIVSFSNGYTILVPKTELGDRVKVKIIKIHQAGKKSKFAFAKVIELLEKGQKKIPVSVGMNVTVKVIYSNDSVAIAKNENGPYFFIIPQKIGLSPVVLSEVQSEQSPEQRPTELRTIVQETNERCKIGDQFEIIVTRIKNNYAFAKRVIIGENSLACSELSKQTGSQSYPGLRSSSVGIKLSTMERNYSKFNIILPKVQDSVEKVYQNFAIAFVRLGSNCNWTSELRSIEKEFRIRHNLRSTANFSSLLNNVQSDQSPFVAPKNSLGLHGDVASNGDSNNLPICLFIKLNMGAKLGDKVRVKISQIFHSSSGLPYAFGKIIKINPITIEKKTQKIKQNIEQMLKSGMHFGEKAVKCEAKMREYIWIRKKGRNKNRPFIKKGRHFLNLLKTRRCLYQAQIQLAKYAIKGRTFLFVGTKKPAASLISRAALFSKKSFFVNTRWLGGMLTNWKTILKSISKIRPILQEKQKIIQMILTKRQGIKQRLMKKILTSMKYIQKGRKFLDKIKKNPLKFIAKNKAFTTKRKELIEKGQQLLFKRQQLLEKRKELYKQSRLLKEKGFQIVNKYQNLLKHLINQKQKLKEFQNQALLCREIKKIKQNAITINMRREGIDNPSILTGPNPSKEILNKILQGLAISSFGETSFSIDKSERKYRLIILNKLLSKFAGGQGHPGLRSDFYSFIKTSMKTISENIQKILTVLNIVQKALKKIQNQMTIFINIKKKLLLELGKIKIKLVAEQKIIKILKTKIKRSAAEKRFFKFLPKLRYLPTATADAANSIQILMQKFVDPKIKQATSSIHIEASIQSKTKSKKIAAARKKKWQRLEKYFGGVANMLKMNKNKISKNVAIIIGQQEEMNAVRECQKLGIQMFHIVDTNCNPTLANHYVPANDDSRNSIQFILTKFLKYIRLAQKLRLRLWKSTSKKKKVAVKAGLRRAKLK